LGADVTAVVALGLLDTSVIVDLPAALSDYAQSVCVSAVSIGELAFGLHIADPMASAAREQRYRDVLATYDPIPYDATVAHWFGAIAAAVRASGRNPRARVADLMVAATAKSVDAAVLTRNASDFDGIDHIVRIVAVGG
jgi:predicted nucleic acid-binding protein